jgi:uncharacterized membrane-anchored protein
MTETINYEQIEELSLEQTDMNSNAQLEETNNYEQLEQQIEKFNETIEFLTECNMSILDFTKDKTNAVILTPKEKTIKKKYRLYQYNLYNENYVYIGKYATFLEITKYLENINIKINLKTLLKNKLLKIELLI